MQLKSVENALTSVQAVLPNNVIDTEKSEDFLPMATVTIDETSNEKSVNVTDTKSRERSNTRLESLTKDRSNSTTQRVTPNAKAMLKPVILSTVKEDTYRTFDTLGGTVQKFKQNT